MGIYLWVFLVISAPAATQEQAGPGQSAAGCGPDAVQFDVTVDKKQHPFAPAVKDQAVVYVFENEVRERAAYIGSVSTRVGVDGQWMGANKGKSYFFFLVAPGAHRLCVDRHRLLGSSAKPAGAASFTAEAGKVYFFLAEVEERDQRQYPPAITLQQVVDNAQAMHLISSSAFSVSHPKK